MNARSTANLRRWHAAQIERRQADLAPVMARVEALRAQGLPMTDIHSIVDAEGFKSRTGAAWTYPGLTQAYYKWRKTAAA